MGTNIPEISPVDIWGEEVEIIDAYGTWGQYKEVLYDIMGMDERALFKHVNFSFLPNLRLNWNLP